MERESYGIAAIRALSRDPSVQPSCPSHNGSAKSEPARRPAQYQDLIADLDAGHDNHCHHRKPGGISVAWGVRQRTDCGDPPRSPTPLRWRTQHDFRWCSRQGCSWVYEAVSSLIAAAKSAEAPSEANANILMHANTLPGAAVSGAFPAYTSERERSCGSA